MDVEEKVDRQCKVGPVGQDQPMDPSGRICETWGVFEYSSSHGMGEVTPTKMSGKIDHTYYYISLSQIVNSSANTAIDFGASPFNRDSYLDHSFL